jgi:RNA polymerase sigma-70 factor (ECF subfamily)
MDRTDDRQLPAWLDGLSADLSRAVTPVLDVDRLLVTVAGEGAVAASIGARADRRAAAVTVTAPTTFDDLPAMVAVAVEGNRNAVERLLGYLRPLVVRYCRARVGYQERSFASADDVAQEACLAVITALHTYRDQGRPFLAFVYGITAHKVADAHRAVARNKAEPVAEVPDGPDTEAGPEQHAMRTEMSSRMAELLQVLPAKQREILVLRVVVGLSAEETADAVGSTPGAVRVAQHRALHRLRGSSLLADLL